MWGKAIVTEGAIFSDVVNSRQVGVYSAGNVVVTGIAVGGADFGNGFNYGAGDIYVAKYDPQGRYLWAMRSAGNAGGSGITTDLNRNIYVTGSMYGDVTLDGLQVSTPGTQSKSAFLLKISP